MAQDSSTSNPLPLVDDDTLGQNGHGTRSDDRLADVRDDGSSLPTQFSGRARRQRRTPGPSRRKLHEVLGPEDSLGEGDSHLVVDVLPEDLAEVAFEKLREEVKWNTMYHRGGEVPRLVAVEGQVGEDGSFPVYRHPADESPPLSSWSPTVAAIREHVQQILDQPVNHVLIQLYRSGKDAISEHSDKTIDVVRGSSIVNVSLGAQRVMTLRAKKDWARLAAVGGSGDGGNTSQSEVTTPHATVDPTTVSTTTSSDSAVNAGIDGHGALKNNEDTPTESRQTQRIPLPHNSMFVMGPETNRRWLHGINPDNRPVKIKSEAERYQGGERISLTFRHIGTYLSKDEKVIWGQGAKGKAKEEAGSVISGSRADSQRLIDAFGEENQRSDFNWDKVYGEGSDVLHFSSSAL
ncbi:hypothetical protein BDN72DRAFT_958386 [Pluteus cervinus]|uniref:Uncharacterized protein n=1 Tax=Pluteus cervinus TaxID=181527 RepID=A0ACD3AYX8_9AGAR|nr:hypothetical protein BDN72DRAFT_958386 [Pluteus cervinus]